MGCAGSHGAAQPTERSCSSLRSSLALRPVVAGRRFFVPDALLESVFSGSVAPLRGRYLLELWKCGGRLQRRQDLPLEAFWEPEELAALTSRLSSWFGLLFVAVSCRWLSPGHPDPDGFHLKIVGQTLEKYLSVDKRGGRSPLASVFEWAGLLGVQQTDCAVFWDFASLPQPPPDGERNEREASLFEDGVKASGVWFGHRETVVWMQSLTPPGTAFPSQPLRSYEDSGWCFVESVMSAALTLGDRRLDLGRAFDRNGVLDYEVVSYAPPRNATAKALVTLCAAQRTPILLPEDVAAQLETTKAFLDPSDAGRAAALYRDFFESVAPETEVLDFHDLEWGLPEAEVLCRALPRFTACCKLDLSGNAFGSQGAALLAESLRGNARLAVLKLDVPSEASARQRERSVTDGGQSMPGVLKLVDLVLSLPNLLILDLGGTVVDQTTRQAMLDVVVRRPDFSWGCLEGFGQADAVPSPRRSHMSLVADGASPCKDY